MLSHKGLSFDQQRQKICMRRARNANTSLVWAELHIGPQDNLYTSGNQSLAFKYYQWTLFHLLLAIAD